MFAVDTSNRPQLAKEFTTSIGATFPIVLDDEKISGSLFGVQYTPTTLMIDRSGRILFSSIGFAPGKEKALAAQIEYLLQRS